MKKIKRAIFKACQKLYWGGFSLGNCGVRSMIDFIECEG